MKTNLLRNLLLLLFACMISAVVADQVYTNFGAVKIDLPASATGSAFLIADANSTTVYSVSTAGAVSGTGAARSTSVQFSTNGESIANGTDSTITLQADTVSGVTLTSADTDSTAALTVLPGGASALTLGGASTTGLTVTTDGTGNAEVALPTGSIGTGEILDGTLLPADVQDPGLGVLQICGDLTTINNNTIYYGPNRAVVATTASGLTCDTTAVGNATEATADEKALEGKAFQVLGMTCRTVDTNNTVSFTLRNNAGATVPSVTCSTADNELDCVADIQTTTAIASGNPIAIAAASTGDLGAAAFVCNINIAY